MTVPEICSCGARLPEDARFCHKCGKPQRDSDIEVVPPVIAPPPPPIEAAPVRPDPAIGFRNPLAVRPAFFASLAGFLMAGVAGQIYEALPLLAMLGAGAFAVYLYRRRTGLPVSIQNGIHIGWITGVFSFVTAMILVAIITVTLANSDPEAIVKASLGSRYSPELARKTVEMYRSPQGLMSMIGAAFLVCAVMPTLGGALSALLRRRGETP